jgi:[lysine-biosynthesis-protein LysW]---L-2-aminoadipate ligase
MLYSIIRVEEKLLIRAAEKMGLEMAKIDDRECIFGLSNDIWHYDVVLERCISHSKALYALKFLNEYGIKTVNTYEVANCCGDKAFTSIAFEKNGIPTPKTFVAFEPESAIRALERIGYPAVMKPVVGSWGRLLAKIDNRNTAEAIIEHKEVLGSYLHQIYYVQEYVDKPQRDIRAFVVGDQTICAVYRESAHWITNTARGAKTVECKVTDELNDLCVRAAHAVGGGIIAVDVMETKSGAYTVHEANYTMEFRNSIVPTGIDIPQKILEYVVEVAKR